MADRLIDKVKQVNEILLKGEAAHPSNVSVDTYGGYIGYKPQAIIDAMNEVFDIGSWGFQELSNEIDEGLVIAQVEAWIKGVDFRPQAYGQSRVTKGDRGDAKKGGQTDAMKKALSYFSVGNRAYNGLLVDPDKNRATGQNTNRATSKPASAPAPAATTQQRPAPAQPTAHVTSPVTQPATNGATVQTTKPVTSNETDASAKSKIVPPTVKELQDSCTKLCGAGQWQTAIQKVLKNTMPVKDASLTPDDLAKIAGYLDKVAEAKRELARMGTGK